MRRSPRLLAVNRREVPTPIGTSCFHRVPNRDGGKKRSNLIWKRRARLCGTTRSLFDGTSDSWQRTVRKIEMLKERSKYIAQSNWQKPVLAYVDKLEPIRD